MNERGWSGLFVFMTVGCLATQVSDGSGAADDNARHETSAIEPALSFVAGLTCTSSADCGRRFYCRYPEGECGVSGTCEIRPRTCTSTDAAVCGCDGETYASACLASSAGISIEATGPCSQKGERCGNSVCDEGLECCNASCGICVAPGGVCTQQACE